MKHNYALRKKEAGSVRGGASGGPKRPRNGETAARYTSAFRARAFRMLSASIGTIFSASPTTP